MNLRLRLSLLSIAAIALALPASLHAQEVNPTAAVVPKSALERMQEVKAANARLLETQRATLLRLEELEKQARQLRIFTKRS